MHAGLYLAIDPDSSDILAAELTATDHSKRWETAGNLKEWHNLCLFLLEILQFTFRWSWWSSGDRLTAFKKTRTAKFTRC
jgi:hypothetical protein